MAQPAEARDKAAEQQQRRWLRTATAQYSLVVLGTVVVAGIRGALDPLARDSAHYTLFFFSVALGAALKGWRGGLLATLLGAGLGFSLFIYLPGRFDAGLPRQYVQLGLYLTTCILVTALGAWGQGQRQRAVRGAETLRESESTLRLALAAGRIGIWQNDYRAGRTTLSEVALSAFGFGPSESQVQSIEEVRRRFHPEDRERVLAQIRQALAEKREYASEFRVVLPDGSTRWVSARGTVSGDAQQAVKSIGALVDMTEHKRAEEELRRSRELLVQAEQLSHTGAWEWDVARNQWTFSDEWLAVHGCHARKPKPEELLTIAHPEDRAMIAHAFDLVRKGQAAYDLEHRILRQDNGEVRFVRAQGQSLSDAAGKVVRIHGFAQDITERKRAEEALKESEQRYRSFIEASAQVVWTTNARGEVNLEIPAWQAYTGQSAEEAHGFGWMNAIAPEDRERVAQAWAKAFESKGIYEVEYRLRRHDGAWRHILARGVPVFESTGHIREYVGTCRDITERKQAQERLRKQARLIDLAPAATFVRTTDGTITFWSEGAKALYGWTANEAIGRRSHELLHTQFSENAGSILAKLQHGGKWSGELLHYAKDGREVLVESHWLGQLSPDGQITEILESNMDITARKQAEQELRRLKDQLEIRVERRTAELAAANKELEAFGYSVSHDLRAPLRHIDSYIGMLQKSIGPTLDEKSQRHLRIVTEAAKRMGNLIDDLLTLSRLGRASMEERQLSLRQLIDGARQELAPAMKGRALQWHVGPLPEVRGDEILLRSAMVNLLSNAVKYTRQRTPAVIEVGSREQEGEFICFVRDNGAGFDMRFADKLFGVFQRLHAAHEFEGTGIGLASVRRVIQRHGGRTWAEGEPGKGATFYFSLPMNRVITERAQEAEAA